MKIMSGFHGRYYTDHSERNRSCFSLITVGMRAQLVSVNLFGFTITL
jgi:hypothetical protein